MGRDKTRGSVERIFYTFQEPQEFLGVSHQTVYKLMKAGLSSHTIGENDFPKRRSYKLDKRALIHNQWK